MLLLMTCCLILRVTTNCLIGALEDMLFDGALDRVLSKVAFDAWVALTMKMVALSFAGRYI